MGKGFKTKQDINIGKRGGWSKRGGGGGVLP